MDLKGNLQRVIPAAVDMIRSAGESMNGDPGFANGFIDDYTGGTLALRNKIQEYVTANGSVSLASAPAVTALATYLNGEAGIWTSFDIVAPAIAELESLINAFGDIPGNTVIDENTLIPFAYKAGSWLMGYKLYPYSTATSGAVLNLSDRRAIINPNNLRALMRDVALRDTQATEEGDDYGKTYMEEIGVTLKLSREFWAQEN